MKNYAELYEEDFYAWTQFQARELQRVGRRGTNLPLDFEHLAEEVRDIGKEQRNSLRSWLTRIVEHLLLLEHSPAQGPRPKWRREIDLFREEIEDRMTETLHRGLERRLPMIYQRAIKALRRRCMDYNEPMPDLPETCPYTLEQLLSDWWPENRHGMNGAG